ncbi:DUF975 family protein [Lentilactobacillus rapi]|uniref:DUF975 family protein n=1 Tax=Lentilactobacillus rapi TaxID=481723 RepID=UPI000A8237FC|nr:DUF975 family protein [Lentilactobacillus rapi]
MDLIIGHSRNYQAFSYSQAYYIYRDAIDHGEQIGYLDAITRSRQLMDGHKWEYFVMILSFIGWGLVVLITFGIAAIWVQPYYTLSFANFYNELADQQTVQPPLRLSMRHNNQLTRQTVHQAMIPLTILNSNLICFIRRLGRKAI